MKFEGETVHVTKPELSALLAFALHDDTRTLVACVRFEPERGRAIATDGHRLLVLQTEPGGGACEWPSRQGNTSFAVSSRALTRAVRPFGGNAKLMLSVGSNGSVNIRQHDLDADPLEEIWVEIPPILKVEFPNVDPILDEIVHDDETVPLAEVSLNPKFLTELAHIGRIQRANETPECVRIRPGAEAYDKASVSADLGDETTAVMVLMPMNAVTVSSVTARRCVTCGASFSPPRADAKFCTSACRQKAYRERQAAE